MQHYLPLKYEYTIIMLCMSRLREKKLFQTWTTSVFNSVSNGILLIMIPAENYSVNVVLIQHSTKT